MTHSFALQTLLAATKFNLASTVTTNTRGRGRTQVCFMAVPYIKKTRLQGRYTPWTKHVTGIQNSRFHTDLSHYHPSAPWHQALGNQSGKAMGGHLVPVPEQGRTDMWRWGWGTGPPSSISFILQWERKDEIFLSAVVLNLSILVFCC